MAHRLQDPAGAGGGPYTLLVAHYDKSRETPTYPAASDNTAAVAVLLAALGDLVSPQPTRGRGKELSLLPPRPELLDEDHLDLARRFVVGVAGKNRPGFNGSGTELE